MWNMSRACFPITYPDLRALALAAKINNANQSEGAEFRRLEPGFSFKPIEMAYTSNAPGKVGAR